MGTSRILAAIGFASVCAMGTGCAGTADVTGRVVSQTTGSGVASATVTWGEEKAWTDSSGTFSLSRVKKGRQTFKVSFEGYPPGSTRAKVSKATTPLEIKLPDSAIIGKVQEVAVEPKVVTDANLTVGERRVLLTESGGFTAAGLRPGETTLTVVSPNRMKRSTVIDLQPGDNSGVAPISLDATETSRRFNKARASGRWAVAYKYMHPDVRRLESFEVFRKNADYRVSLVPHNLDIRPVKRFRSKYTRKMYPVVTRIDRVPAFPEMEYDRQASASSQHWELGKDGRWYLIWDFPRD